MSGETTVADAPEPVAAEAPAPAPDAGENPPETAEGDRCLSCGTVLTADQEWCVECGAARTTIHRSRGWTVPIVLVGAVFTVGLIVLAVALVNLSGDANRLAAQQIADTTATVTVPGASQTVTAITATPSTVTVTTAAPSAAVAVPGSSGARAETPAGAATVVTTTRTTRTVAAAAATPATPVTSKPVLAPLAKWPPGLGGWTVVLAVTPHRRAALSTGHRLAKVLAGIGVLNTSDHPSLPPGNYVVFAGRYPDGASAAVAARRLRVAGYPYAHPRMVEPPGGN